MSEKPAQVDMEMPERSLVPHDSLSVRHAKIGGAEASSVAAPASAQPSAAKQRRPSLMLPKPSWRVLAISAMVLAFALGAALAVEAGKASRLDSSSLAQQRQYKRLELEYQQLLAANHSTPLSVHVLDTSLGVPGGGMAVTLEALMAGGWSQMGRATTATTGRASAGLLPPRGQLKVGTYRLTFNTSEYYAALGQRCFYPEVAIVFHVDVPTQHYHIPLLVSPFGYSTYRGS